MGNLERWMRAKFTRSTQINAQAAKIEANRARYEAVSAKTGVPDLGSQRGYWASRNVARQAAGVTETATYGGSGTHLLFNAAIWA